MGGLYLALLGWSALSLIWSVNRYDTLYWLTLLVFAGVAFQITYATRSVNRVGATQRWWSGYLYVASAMALYGMYVYVVGNYDRLISTFYWPNPAAIWLLPASIMALWLVVGRSQWNWLPALTLTTSALILTGSRTVALWAGAILAAGVVVALRRKARPNLIALGVAVVATAALVFSLNFARSEAGKSITVTDNQRFQEVAEGKASTIELRKAYLNSAIDMAAARPLTGWGGGTYATVHPGYQDRAITAGSSAHNSYVQAFAELGVVGGLLLLALAATLLWELLSGGSRGARIGAILAAALLIHFAVDIDARYPAIIALTAALLALAVRRQDAGGRVFRPRIVQTAVTIGTLVGLAAAGLMLSSERQYDNGKFYQQNAEYDRAQEAYAAAHGLPLSNPDAITAEGIMVYTRAFLVQGDERATQLSRAQQLAERAIAADSRDAQHYQLKGRTLRSKGDAAGAEAALRRAIELDPNNQPLLYVDLADLLLFQQRSTEAITLLDQALPRYDDATVVNRSAAPAFRQAVVTLYLVRARAYGDAGQADKQAADIESARRLSPQ